MPRKPFRRFKIFGKRKFSFHSNPRSLRLAKQKIETLRNKGLLARLHRKKSTSGGFVYAVYEARRKVRKKGSSY